MNNLRLAKIRNRYIFNSNDPKGVHYYAIYYDRPNKWYNAIQLTHLYTKENKRFSQIKSGTIATTKFKEFDVPSGVRNDYYDSNVNGGKINIKDKDDLFVSKRYLSKNQSSFIKNFARKKHK